MIDDRPSSPATSPATRQTGVTLARRVAFLIRLIGGYIIAVLAGAIIFSIVSGLVLPGGIFNNPTPDMSSWLRQTGNLSVLFFVLGLVFGLPYAILASLAFKFVLPHNSWTFMLIGLLCPISALFLLGMGPNGKVWWDWQFAKLATLTLTSGIVSTYLFGAIGFGLGFGRWRFA